jgi:predicted RNA-binding protein (virulence factor B family)
MIRPIEEVLLPPKIVVDCEIHQRTDVVDGVCYRDEKGRFWAQTFQDSVGVDAETSTQIVARQIARRHGIPLDGRVVRVRFVEVAP